MTDNKKEVERAELDVNSNKQGATVIKRNEELVAYSSTKLRLNLQKVRLNSQPLKLLNKGS